ncbi:type IV pilus secretin PilQ [Pseudomonas aeruginosa]|nr:type IV pilus secretin PilQ [Pseudomonas aeruginosa]
MNSGLSRLGIALLAAMFAPALLAADLEKLDVAALPGDRVELKLQFDEPVAAPRGYTIEQPARIALDLPGVQNKLGTKNRELSVGNTRSVTVVEAKDRTRLIINLTTLSSYTTRVEGNNLFVVVGNSPAGASVASAAPVKASPAPASYAQPIKPKPYVPAGRAIRNIDFQRGEKGEGNVVIDLSDPTLSPDIQEQGGKIRLDFAKTQLPDALRVRLDVKDFATPVQFVNASAQSDRTSITIEPSGLYDYLVYQTDNRLTVSIKPMTTEDAERRKKDNFAYTGEKLSLNFQDIDVRSVLQLIADFTDLNLVASDTVQGNITLRLQNVPWDQALDLVLKTKGLDKRKLGNVLLVAPADEIAARERQELEAQKQIAELAPLRRELIQVNYAKAADIAKLFQSVTSDGGQEGKEGGRGPIAGNCTFPTTGTSKSPSPFVDIGAKDATSGIGIGFITDNIILDLQLSAMEKTGNGEIVSQPKVVTSDKETAKILKGQEVPYQEASSSGATSTSFKEAALSLEVTPQITPDNRIIVEVKVTKDAPDFDRALNGVPPINKNEVNAKILVNDGETIVIGGVFSNTQSKSVDKVPFLGDLPYLGRLFRRDTVSDVKNELLVFLTPRIMNNQAIAIGR